MNYDVTQWLQEIESLQKQLTETQNDRTAAESTAEHWRQLYNTEAQQRREDTKAAQVEIARLQDQLQQLQTPTQVSDPHLLEVAQHEVEGLPADQLRPQLIDLRVECDRLRQEVSLLTAALQTEQENHAKTRTELTTALGDTVSLLTKAKTKDRSPLIPDFLSDTPLPEESASQESRELQGIESIKQIAPSLDHPWQLPPSQPTP